jgi:ADP-heptose:LPS heptosyltransferase
MGLLKAHRLGNPLPQTLILIRALPGLGDLLCWTPALRALRSALPDAHITWMGLPESAALVERFSQYFDDWIAFPGFPGIPEVALSPSCIVASLQQIQQREFDWALQMHGSGAQINSFALLLGAKQTAGYFPDGEFCPNPRTFLPYPEQESEIWRHLRLLEFLGIQPQGEQPEFPLWLSDWQKLELLVADYNLRPDNYICIHPGASVATRRWSQQHFIEVADKLAAQGQQIVLTGTAAEIELTESIAASMQFPAINLAGKTDLGTVAALLKQAKLLICNDTGISHLAAALQVKSVVIFTDSDPARWAPLDRERHRIVTASGGRQSEAVLAEATCLMQEVAYV